MKSWRWNSVIAALALAAAPGPGRIAAAVVDGHPACDYCRMFLENERFGAEIATVSGERLRFDALECAAAFVLTDSGRVVRSVYAVDYEAPRRRLPVEKAAFLHSDALPSPMQMNLSAFRSAARAGAARRRHGGTVLSWKQSVALVHRVWFRGSR